MSKPTIQALFEHAVHYGHAKKHRNPKMDRYIYGLQDGIHIINLEKTLENLEKATEFITRCSKEGKSFLFVGTKPQGSKALRDHLAGTEAHMVTKKWPAGLLTNFDTIKKRIKYLKDLRDMERTGEFEKYTKKEVAVMKKEQEKLEIALGGVINMERTPDVLVVIDVCKERNAVKEAKLLGIPVVAIVDTNADPELVDYAVPGNDDTIKSLSYLAGILVDAYKSGGKK